MTGRSASSSGAIPFHSRGTGLTDDLIFVANQKSIGGIGVTDVHNLFPSDLQFLAAFTLLPLGDIAIDASMLTIRLWLRYDQRGWSSSGGNCGWNNSGSGGCRNRLLLVAQP